ncbi:MAG: response regulator [Prolixibacteraceae bacterium]|nr:response regulator [Prolixibacteraceae bacterium]
MIRNIFFLIIISVFVQMFLPLQVKAETSINIENLTNKTGLPEGAINCIAQDSYGFIWIGTWKGLFRYDGYDVINFSAINRHFNALKIEEIIINNNDLWVGSFVTGLFKINLENYLVTHYSKEKEDNHKISDNNIISLCAAPDNNIFVGTERGGLCVINPEGEVTKTYSPEKHPNILRTRQISKITYLKDNTIVIGNNGLTFFNYKTEEAKIYTYPGIEYFISDMISINDNELLVSSLESLFYLNISEPVHEIKQILNRRVKSMIFKKDSYEKTIIIGSVDGLAEYNVSTHSIKSIKINEDQTAPVQNITSAIYTSDDVILIGSENGLFSYNQTNRYFNNYSTKPGGTIPDIISDIEISDKNFFAGSWGKGLLKLNKKSGYLEDVNFSNYDKRTLNFIFSLKKVNDRIWFSTKNNLGVFSFAEDSEPYSLKYYNYFRDKNNVLQNYTVTYILERKDKSILLSTWEGILFYYDRSEDTFMELKSKNDEAYLSRDLPIYSMIEDNEGNLWLALNGGGVIKMRIESNTILSQEKISEEEGLASNFVTTLYQSRNNKIWVGTEAGLTVIDGKDIKTILNKDITFDIQSIIEDPIGFLWIGTQKGLIRINSNNTEESYKLFDAYDGLKNQAFFLNSIYKDSDFTFYFGGYKGIDYFTPYKIDYNYNKPHPKITGFYLFNEKVFPCREEYKDVHPKIITGAESIKLKHNQNTFAFELSNLEYRIPEKCQYAYFLEGIDKDWNYRDSYNRIAYYTKVSPGTYTLKIKSTNNDGVWSEEPVSVSIYVKPPVWATTWAYLTYLILGMFFIFMILYLRILKVQEDHKQKLKEVEYEKQMELDDLKLKFFTNISHEFRTPLTLILGPLARILEEEKNDPLKEKHLMIYRNASRLLQLTNRIIDFRKNEKDQLKLKVSETNISDFIYNIFLFFKYEAQKRNINYTFNSGFNGNIPIDHEFVESIVFNLLSNAFKYTPDNREIKVNIFTEGEWLKISFADTGKGILQEHLKHIFDRFNSITKRNSAGIGLSFSQRLIEIHKGKINVESELNKGSNFTLFLPLHDIYSEEEKETVKVKEMTADWKKIDQSLQEEIQTDLNRLKTDFEKEELIALIVDDNFEVRQFIKSLLNNDFKVLEASNGKEALEIAFENIPDIVISDVMMPEMDGYELCHTLKTDDRTDHIPVILTTVLSTQADRLEGLKIGADSYIPKPIDPDHLLIRINKLIERQLKQKEKFNLNNYSKDIEITEEEKIEVHPLVERAREIVLKNLDNSDYNIDDFCSDLRLSRMQLYRKFKAITGLSANSFIRKVRLYKAAELLKSGELSVKEVTYDVGFIDLKYFRKCFYDEFGVNPSEYAQNTNSD